VKYPPLQFNDNKPIDLNTSQYLFNNQQPTPQPVSQFTPQSASPSIPKPLFVPKDNLSQTTPKIINQEQANQYPLNKAANFLGDQFNKNQEAYNALTIPLSGGKKLDVTGFAAPLKAVNLGREAIQEAPQVFKEFKDLTTRVLENLKGKSKVSKQFIENLTNQPQLKQAERDIIRETLQDSPKDVSVKEFADRVKTRLLPLKVREPTLESRYENIALPPELRGNVANYSEHIYESPIKTSAGDVHFDSSQFPNYFAHTRVEDLADKTRRVIEIQSDLMQKGRLEEENFKVGGSLGGLKPLHLLGQEALGEISQNLEQLQPYRNTWYERIIREEIKKAAQDGKTTLLFPTGETAMKIEGLGESNNFFVKDTTGVEGAMKSIKKEELKVGKLIRDNASIHGNDWIITDVLGDGKFRAVPKGRLESVGIKTLSEASSNDMRFIELGTEAFDISGKVDTSNPIYKFYEKDVQKFLKHLGMNMKQIKDPQGVEWFKIPVKKEIAEEPVLNLGHANLKTILKTAGISAGGATGALGIKKAFKQSDKPNYTYKRKGNRLKKQDILKAIAYNETGIIPEGKKYSYHKYSGDPKLGEDMGKYQVTEGELKRYSKRYYGRQLTPDEFLNNPKIQDDYMLGKIRYLREAEGYSDDQIIVMHNGGLNIDTETLKARKYVQKARNYLKERKIKLKAKKPLFIKQ